MGKSINHPRQRSGYPMAAPILLSIIDKEGKLRVLLPLLDEMIQQGLVVLSDVDAIKYTHDYPGANRRREVRS